MADEITNDKPKEQKTFEAKKEVTVTTDNSGNPSSMRIGFLQVVLTSCLIALFICYRLFCFCFFCRKRQSCYCCRGVFWSYCLSHRNAYRSVRRKIQSKICRI